MTFALRLNCSFSRLAGLVLVLSTVGAVFAQSNGTSRSAAATAAAAKQHIETEIVTLQGGRAFPSQITRKPGIFFLEIIGRTADPALNIALLPTSPGLDKVSVANAVDLKSLQVKRRSAGAVDLLPGEYQLQSTATGQVLCTITVK